MKPSMSSNLQTPYNSTKLKIATKTQNNEISISSADMELPKNSNDPKEPVAPDSDVKPIPESNNSAKKNSPSSKPNSHIEPPIISSTTDVDSLNNAKKSTLEGRVQNKQPRESITFAAFGKPAGTKPGSTNINRKRPFDLISDGISKAPLAQNESVVKKSAPVASNSKSANTVLNSPKSITKESAQKVKTNTATPTSIPPRVDGVNIHGKSSANIKTTITSPSSSISRTSDIDKHANNVNSVNSATDNSGSTQENISQPEGKKKSPVQVPIPPTHAPLSSSSSTSSLTSTSIPATNPTSNFTPAPASSPSSVSAQQRSAPEEKSEKVKTGPIIKLEPVSPRASQRQNQTLSNSGTYKQYLNKPSGSHVINSERTPATKSNKTNGNHTASDSSSKSSVISAKLQSDKNNLSNSTDKGISQNQNQPQGQTQLQSRESQNQIKTLAQYQDFLQSQQKHHETLLQKNINSSNEAQIRSKLKTILQIQMYIRDKTLTPEVAHFLQNVTRGILPAGTLLFPQFLSDNSSVKFQQQLQRTVNEIQKAQTQSQSASSSPEMQIRVNSSDTLRHDLLSTSKQDSGQKNENGPSVGTSYASNHPDSKIIPPKIVEGTQVPLEAQKPSASNIGDSHQNRTSNHQDSKRPASRQTKPVLESKVKVTRDTSEASVPSVIESALPTKARQPEEVHSSPTQAAAPKPAATVFQCKSCNKIVSDSYAWVAALSDDNGFGVFVVNSVVPGSVTIVPGSSQLTSLEGPDKGASYFETECTSCNKIIGRIYVTTPWHMDFARRKYTFIVKDMTYYSVGDLMYMPQDISETIEELLKPTPSAVSKQLAMVETMLLTMHKQMEVLTRRLSQYEQRDGQEKNTGNQT